MKTMEAGARVIMRKLIGLCVLFAGLMCFVMMGYCYAQNVQNDNIPVATDTYGLMRQAVEYATKADAYNAYCSEPSSMASNFLDKFDQSQDITLEQKAVLTLSMEQVVQDFSQWLKKDRPSCTDLEFMIGRLEVMHKLKDVSYLLNGVDPAILPEDNIPELKDLISEKIAE